MTNQITPADQNSRIINSFSDELRIEGINFKGYGIIPKCVTLSSSISIEAKAIYAYFASYAGSGNSAFPSRDKIISDLKISKDRYYKHFHLLLSEGFICVRKEEGCGFTRNIYILTSGSDDSSKPGHVTMSGIKSSGYGIIPKAVAIDPRLPIEAKGLFAYYASFTGSGTSCTPKRSDVLYHLNISANRYTKYRDILENLGYITVSRLHKDGLLSSLQITLMDNPSFLHKQGRKVTVITSKHNQVLQNKDAADMAENCDNNLNCSNQVLQNKDIDSIAQLLQNQDVQNQDPQIQATQNKDTNNIKLNNNNIEINKEKKRVATMHEDAAYGIEASAPLSDYKFTCPIGSITLTQEQKDKLQNTFSDLNGLLEMSICALAQRLNPPKSIFHFVWELALTRKWPKTCANINPSNDGKSENPAEEYIKKMDELDSLEREERVIAFMKENGIGNFSEAEALYDTKVAEELQKKLNIFLSRA